MTRDELKQRVDDIIAQCDSEAQHTQEDQLHMDVIAAFCPKWVAKEIKRLFDADFERWCA